MMFHVEHFPADAGGYSQKARAPAPHHREHPDHPFLTAHRCWLALQSA